MVYSPQNCKNFFVWRSPTTAEIVKHKEVTTNLQNKKKRNCGIFQKAAFILVAIICLWPKVDTAIALAAGIIFSLLFSKPFPKHTSKLSKLLL